ncbi:NAD(P)-binding protein [Mycena olivaceomarginata]|nr:NAD(P)-binding protein [Mycena olivaceomarginata]
MTITQATSAPLIAVVGATGLQGGSVIKALSESDKPYRIRGFTRDATKAAAEALKKQGVEMVAVNLVVENKQEVYKAFAGADYAFLVTSFQEHYNKEREISEGKMLIDATKAAGVQGVVWSGLSNVTKLSGGKYTNVTNFDGKALVTEYGRASGVPFVDVQAGLYSTGFLKGLLVKQPDGTYAISWATKPTTVISMIDVENDFGLYVRWVLEMPVFPDGLEVRTSSENITPEGNGASDFRRHRQDGRYPPAGAAEIAEEFLFFDEFGFYGGAETTSTEGLARPTRTFAEFVKGADWSKAFCLILY